MNLWMFACLVGMSSGVGIKRRMEAAGSEPDVDTEDQGSRGEGRGGVRARVSAAATSSSSTAVNADLRDLPLNSELKADWALGKLTSGQVQRYALNAMRQGAGGLQDLARAGSEGRNPQNVFRALKTAFGLPRGATDIDWIDLPMLGGRHVAHPFLLPHRFFASLLCAREDMFRSTISGPDGACRQFWEAIRETAFVAKHPALPESLWQRIVPLGVHADAGAFSHQDSLYAISWNSLVGGGQTLTKRFLFTVLRKSEMSEDTLDAALRIMSWSFNILIEGVTPSVDWAGRPLRGGGEQLAGSWRGALCQVRGDWAFFKECFHFPQWNGATRMCWICRASSVIENLLWTNCRANAGWRQTLWTDQAYRRFLRREGLAVPVLLAAVAGMRLENIMIDVLHTVDLGISAHILANVFWILAIVRGVLGGATQSEKVKKLHEDLNAWYRAAKVTTRLQGKLTIERLRTSGQWPKLKAKAAATRHMAGYALHLITAHQDGSEGDALMLAICQMLVRFYQILES